MNKFLKNKLFVFLYPSTKLAFTFGYFFNCNRACASASASNYKLLLVNKPTYCMGHFFKLTQFQLPGK